MTNKSNIWQNTGGCADKYRCATALYLSLIFSHAYNILIDCGVESLGNDKDVVVGLNTTDKRSI